jgi:hypothetical protein
MRQPPGFEVENKRHLVVAEEKPIWIEAVATSVA